MRSVNADQRKRRTRVLLGEPPDHLSRDQYVTDLIKREMLRKGHRALVIYGNAHGIRKDPLVEHAPAGRKSRQLS